MARWRRVFGFVDRVFGDLRGSRKKTLAALTAGLLRSQKGGLAAIARGMADRTQVKGRIKRIGRFLTNAAFCPWEVTQYLVEALLSGDRESVVALDWTTLGEYQLLKASLVFRRRALPLTWRVVDGWHREKSQNLLSTSKPGHRVLSYFTLGCRILEAYPRRLATNLKLLRAI